MPCEVRAIAAGHQFPLTHRALTVPRSQILRVLNRLFLYSCSKPEQPPVGDHSCTTGHRSWNLCYDSWSLSHLGYLYPGATPVMIKFYHNRSCPWVQIAPVTKTPTIITKVPRSLPGSTRVITHRGVFRLRAGVQE